MRENGIIASFEKVSVNFRFFDDNKRKREINTKCIINFTPKTMQVIANKHLDIVKHKHYEVQINSGEIPAISENNFCQIFDIAKKLRVPLELLMNIVFDINTVSLCGFEERAAIAPMPLMLQGSINYLLLQVEAPDRMIGLELKGNLSYRSKRLLQMDRIIKKYSRKPTDSEIEIAQRNLTNKEYDSAASRFVKAAQIYEEVEDFEQAKKYYRESINAIFSISDNKTSNKMINSLFVDSIGDPRIKSELFKEIANKLLKIGDLKNTTNFVKKLKAVYQSSPFNDYSKAKYYDELIKKIKEGLVSTID